MTPNDPGIPAARDAVMDALGAELERTLSTLGDRAPYRLALRATEERSVQLAATHGGFEFPQVGHRRALAVDARYGSAALDSTHPLRDEFDWTAFASSGSLPIDDDGDALRRAVWAVVEPAVRAAEERMLRVRASHAVKAAEIDPSPDLSEETPIVAVHPRREATLDLAGWRPRLVALSRRLDDRGLERTRVSVTASERVTWVVDGEGTRVRRCTTAARVDLTAETTAPDGARVALTRWKVVHDAADLPNDALLEAWADEVRDDALALAAAPTGEPASGPVLLDGAAAAVWLHEVFGHRAEGHRQKDESEGQTFRECVGRAILQPSISIWDDPSIARLAGEDLAGHYLHDDEGRPAERAHVVRDGVFTGFLMGRSPIRGFSRSNGHGRAAAELRPVSRMGNTVLESSDAVPRAELRRRLVAEAARQGRPWGLVIDRLSGGFTLTGRSFPNSFALQADRAWRVWVDGRPDELLRGLDVVGTPLVALGNLVAVGDDPTVFNGMCGAESGTIPVAAVSPSLLFAQLEVQRQEQGVDRPPVLPPPEASADPLGAEIERVMRLTLPGVPSPYFVAFTLGETDHVHLSAVPGAIVWRMAERERTLGVGLRVGTSTFDSANFGEEGLDGFLSGALPPGDAPGALTRGAWLLADRAWKAAAQNLARKECARRRRPSTASAPDFAPGPPHAATCAPPPPHDPDRLEALVRALGAPLDGPDLLGAQIELCASATTHTFVDSGGTRVSRAHEELCVATTASVRAPDGHGMGDVVRWVVRRADDLPPMDELHAEVRALAARLAAWRQAPPAGDEWVGPVLITGDAAVGLVRWLLLPGLCSTPPREFEDSVPPRDAHPFRVGRRALPPGWSVVDDPNALPHLPSALRWDDEGVPASGPLRLVEDGIVQVLLAGRTPGRDAPASNGRGRGFEGAMPRAAPTQVTVATGTPQTVDALRELAWARAAEAGLDHLLEVRRLVDPPVSDEEVTGLAPLLAWRVYRDGREEAVRNLRFSRLDRRALLDVIAGGPSTTRTLLWQHQADDAGNLVFGFPVTVTAPSLLLGEAHLVPDGSVPSREPVLPAHGAAQATTGGTRHPSSLPRDADPERHQARLLLLTDRVQGSTSHRKRLVTGGT